MKLLILNESRHPVPRSYIIKAASKIQAELNRRQVGKKNLKKELALVFLSSKAARSLNFEFRGRDYSTDVLSFEPVDEGSLGELILCPEVLKKQAREHGLSYRDELVYMILHGILHLLGFDHETNAKDAKKMFQLQDAIFEKLLKSRT
jgi:probable rRNA maturation factor